LIATCIAKEEIPEKPLAPLLVSKLYYMGKKVQLKTKGTRTKLKPGDFSLKGWRPLREKSGELCREQR